MTILQFFTVVVLILQFGCGAAFGLKTCLTWEVSDEHNISFICRVQHFFKPVSLIDNNGLLIANCTFSNNIKTCHFLIPNKMIAVNFTTFEVSFYIIKKNIWQYDGEWTCRLGEEDLVTNIDISRGIKRFTDVVLETYITSKHTLLLECSSCRNSVRNSAEFIIDGKTEDTITYDIESGRCIRHKQPCISKQCSCLSTGNEFNMSISMNFQRSKMYSCEMIFVDPITLEKFSKTTEIEFNGTVFIQRPTRTIIIRHAKWNYTERSSKPPDIQHIESNSIPWTIPLGVSVMIVLFLVVLLIKMHYIRQVKGNSQSLSDIEERRLLDYGHTSKNT